MKLYQGHNYLSLGKQSSLIENPVKRLSANVRKIANSAVFVSSWDISGNFRSISVYLVQMTTV